MWRSKVFIVQCIVFSYQKAHISFDARPVLRNVKHIIELAPGVATISHEVHLVRNEAIIQSLLHLIMLNAY